MKINANKKVFKSTFEDDSDWARWSLRDEFLLNSIQRELPYTVTNRIKRDIRKYGKHTESLLDYVYNTNPMLNARPMDFLDLSKESPASEISDKQPLKSETLSNKKRKQFEPRMRQIREKFAHRTKSRRVSPISKKLYSNAILEEGLKWLDEMAGPEFPEKEITVNFSEEVWESVTRKADEVH